MRAVAHNPSTVALKASFNTLKRVIITPERRKMEQIIKDLEKLVNHMWQEEYDHWEESANPEDHIFHAINNVKNFLIGRKNNE